MYLVSRSQKRKKQLDDDKDTNEIYYIHEFKKSHLEPTKSKNSETKSLQDENIGYLKPKSNLKLFDMCLNFVAENLEHVDSLNDFPEHIGRLLFNECLLINKFDADKSFNSFKCFQKFFNAYSYCMIESLNLANKPDLLRDLTPILSRSHLTSLDLSNCNLIEFDDLNSILVDSLDSLEYLNLSNNKLDDNYVKKLTLAQRLNYSNYSKLTRIDLSENYKLKSIESVCKYFEKYSNLNEIFLSNSIEDLVNEAKLTFFKVCKCVNENEKSLVITSTGWISNLPIEKLISSKKCINSSQEYKDLVKEIRGGKQVNMKLNFYSSSRTSANTNENYTTALNELYKLVKLKRDCKCFCYHHKTSREITQRSFVSLDESNNIKHNKIKSLNYVIDKDLLNLYS